MKKLTLGLVAIGVMALPILTLAQIGGTPPTVSLSLTQLATNIANAVWIVFTVIAVVCFVVAGILFLTAGGAPDKVATARSAFIWGIAGVVVAILAFTIITLVTGFLQNGA